MGLYGGSFDPVHLGHLVLAQDVIEELALDRLHLVPAAANPFKREAEMTGAEHRLEMLRRAVDGMPGVVVDGREIARGGVSYAIDTVLELRREYPDAELFLVLGGDNVPMLELWHRFDELKTLVTFVAFPRGGELAGAGRKQAVPVTSVGRRIDLSSTEIRGRIATGRPVRWLVPEVVRDYIEEHGLYRARHGRPA